MEVLLLLGLVVGVIAVVSRSGRDSGAETAPLATRPSTAPSAPPPARASLQQAASDGRQQTPAPEAATIELDEESEAVLQTVEGDSRSAFITGRAGTGKSTLLQYFRDTTGKAAVVLAPTGLAAVNVGGQTIHSFFRFPPRFIDPDKLTASRNAGLFKRLDTIIVDEVSMVRADLLDGIDRSLRINRSQPDAPFGGVQMVFFGDLFQLSPIVRERELKECFDHHYGGPYFFLGKAFHEHKIACIELQKVYRQQDAEFIDILNAVRENRLDSRELSILNQRVRPLQSPRGGSDYVTLTPTNKAAFELNMQFLNTLSGAERQYQAVVWGKFEESAFPTDETLRLKPEARVMMLHNDPEKRWVNGTLARIVRLEDDALFVTIDGSEHEVKPDLWENIKYTFDRQKNRIEEKVVGTFRQFPIRLAWALTIHKSQGQTFDQVFIDFGSGSFAHGQAYVALSRCRSLEGLALARPISASDVLFDQEVLRYRSYFS